MNTFWRKRGRPTKIRDRKQGIWCRGVAKEWAEKAESIADRMAEWPKDSRGPPPEGPTSKFNLKAIICWYDSIGSPYPCFACNAWWVFRRCQWWVDLDQWHRWLRISDRLLATIRASLYNAASSCCACSLLRQLRFLWTCLQLWTETTPHVSVSICVWQLQSHLNNVLVCIYCTTPHVCMYISYLNYLNTL